MSLPVIRKQAGAYPDDLQRGMRVQSSMLDLFLLLCPLLALVQGTQAAPMNRIEQIRARNLTGEYVASIGDIDFLLDIVDAARERLEEAHKYGVTHAGCSLGVEYIGPQFGVQVGECTCGEARLRELLNREA